MKVPHPPPVGGPLVESIHQQVDRHQSDWAPLLRAWRDSTEGRRLIRDIDERLAAGATIYPPQVFRALQCTPLSATRVLILGQDPYHGAGQAEGLAFSVAPGCRPPPSLRNIFKELRRDLGIEAGGSGSLMHWAQQGVLLLNTALTVEDGQPGSHSRLGWEALTDRIVLAVAECGDPKVFMLWGTHAQSKASLMTGAGARHQLLQCNHPSPLSATRGPVPFIGCGHFGQAAAFLEAFDPGRSRLDWRLDTQAANVAEA